MERAYGQRTRKNPYSVINLNSLSIEEFQYVPPFVLMDLDVTKLKCLREELLTSMTLEQVLQFSQRQLNHFPIEVLLQWSTKYGDFPRNQQIPKYISVDKYVLIDQKKSLYEMLNNAISFQYEKISTEKGLINTITEEKLEEFKKLNAISSMYITYFFNVNRRWVYKQVKNGIFHQVPTNEKCTMVAYDSVINFLNENYMRDDLTKQFIHIERLYDINEVIRMYPILSEHNLLQRIHYRKRINRNELPFVMLSERMIVFRLSDIKEYLKNNNLID